MTGRRTSSERPNVKKNVYVAKEIKKKKGRKWNQKRQTNKHVGKEREIGTDRQRQKLNFRAYNAVTNP